MKTRWSRICSSLSGSIPFYLTYALLCVFLLGAAAPEGDRHRIHNILYALGAVSTIVVLWLVHRHRSKQE